MNENNDDTGVEKGPYSSDFFKERRAGSVSSARAVVPFVTEFITPRSVIDVGTGTGTWLSVFREQGIDDVLGVDGDYVDRRLLEIPNDRFIARDLTQPLRIDRRFDLALSLEVAEHLPPECGSEFVHTLTRLSSVVLFSAAIPFQGGTGHLNEQWPEYWADHFEAWGYVPVDCIRRRIWRNEDVDWWYAQNLLFFVARDELHDHPLLEREYELMGASQLSLVHPQKYLYSIEWGLDLQQRLEAGD